MSGMTSFGIIALAFPLWIIAIRVAFSPHLGLSDTGLQPDPDLSKTTKAETRDKPASYIPGVVKRRATTGTLLFDSDRYEFAMVTDLDKKSRHPEKFLWKSILKRGVIEKLPNGNFTVEWGKETVLKTHTATKNRSMELSDIVRFNRNFFASCDMTGIIFKVEPDTGRTFQRYAIADGDGDETKPFKIEWATVKDNMLWVGSVGKEIEGRLRPAEWVKTIHPSGEIHNVDWGAVYQALRTATNTSFPGYLWHEAIHFDARTRTWTILPRKESNTLYDEEENAFKGSNLLIQASEDFTDIVVKRVGPLDKKYGFTALRKLPGSDQLYIALKVAEYGEVQHTLLTVFDAKSAQIILEPEPFVHVADMKFEGIEFLNFGSQVNELNNKFDYEF